MKNRNFFSKLLRGKTTDVTFEAVPHTGRRSLETQDGGISEFDFSAVEGRLNELYRDADQFVTLTLAEAPHGIRFVQACQAKGGIAVQLGLEAGGRTRLVEKLCSPAECTAIFRRFYDHADADAPDSYRPVEFFT